MKCLQGFEMFLINENSLNNDGECEMDIYSYLRKDHKKVMGIFSKIIHSENENNKQDLLEELSEELILHADAEKATFYTALKKNSLGNAEAIHAIKEHQEVKKIISQLKKTSSESPQWFVLIGELKSLVEHHVKHEETEIFRIAKKILSKSEANNLVFDMESYKGKMTESV